MEKIADPRDIIIKPVVSEKSYGLIDETTSTRSWCEDGQQDPGQDRR